MESINYFFFFFRRPFLFLPFLLAPLRMIAWNKTFGRLGSTSKCFKAVFFFKSGFIIRTHSSVILFMSRFKVVKVLLVARETASVLRASMSSSDIGNCQHHKTEKIGWNHGIRNNKSALPMVLASGVIKLYSLDIPGSSN